ncbi:hypothetical protein BV20DRAFT_1054884 [Pilatotrama ljubarskyi]|nr:hypothetical protein BV20DRAFT_1054884 [Pilatotrama ljubarskyi]
MSTNPTKRVTFASPEAYIVPIPSPLPQATPIPSDHALPRSMYVSYPATQMVFSPPAPYMDPVPLPAVGSTPAWACGASSLQNPPPTPNAFAWANSTSFQGGGMQIAAPLVNTTTLTPVAAPQMSPIHPTLQTGQTAFLWDVRRVRLHNLLDLPLGLDELAFADAAEDCVLLFRPGGRPGYAAGFAFEVRIEHVKGGVRVKDVLLAIDQNLHRCFSASSISSTDPDLYGPAVAARNYRLGRAPGTPMDPAEGWERVDAFLPAARLFFLGLRASSRGPGSYVVQLGDGTQGNWHQSFFIRYLHPPHLTTIAKIDSGSTPRWRKWAAERRTQPTAMTRS